MNPLKEDVYHWDFLNRLVRVDDKATGDLVVGYGYDAFDRRVVKVFEGQVLPATPVSPPQQGRLESWYTYVGPHAVQESRPVSTGGAAPPSAVHVIRQWTYGSGVDEALEMSFDQDGNKKTTDASDPRHYYHYDALGSVIGLTSEAGHLVEGYLYDAYGNVTIRKPGGTNLDVKWDTSDAIVAKSPSENIWFFTGRQLDPETNTYHYRARQYHPGLGQFISMDPIGAWGDPGNLGNPYAYVGNNPSTYRDPSGLYAGVDDAIACGGGALVAAGIRGAMDLWNGKASSWQSYSGEVAGGCVGGVATLYTGPIGGGAAYGGVSSSTRYGLEVASGDRDGSWGQYGKTAGMETVTGAAGGAVAFGAGKVVQAGLRQGTPAMQQIGAGMERGLHPVKGPFAGFGRPDIAPRIARVVPTHYLDDGVTHLGPESSTDVFVTGAKNLAPFQKSGQVAKRLSLLDSNGRYYGRPLTVIEFDAPASVAVPILRSHPGFVGYGRTAGGLPEFTAPNLALSELSNPHFRRLP